MPETDRVERLAEDLRDHLPAIARGVSPDVAALVKETFEAALQRCLEVAKALGHEGPISGIPEAARNLVRELETLRAELARERANMEALHPKAVKFAERCAELTELLAEAEAALAERDAEIAALTTPHLGEHLH